MPTVTRHDLEKFRFLYHLCGIMIVLEVLSYWSCNQAAQNFRLGSTVAPFIIES
jgi:hypothetical protein